MPRWRGDTPTKAKLVRQGLQGKPGAEICQADQLGHALFSRWRDPCLAQASQAVERHQHTRRATRLERANARRKKLVGELILEGNTSAEGLG
jgi:hypothetical protein